MGLGVVLGFQTCNAFPLFHLHYTTDNYSKTPPTEIENFFHPETLSLQSKQLIFLENASHCYPLKITQIADRIEM
jgi:hypothetical protein